MNFENNLKITDNLLDSVVSPFVKFHTEANRSILTTQIAFSSYNNSVWSGNFYPPSSNIIIDRRMLLQATVDVSTTVNDTLFNGSLRAWPLNSIIKSATISINGGSSNSAPQELVAFMQRMNNDSYFRSKYWSLFPSQPDFCNNYAKLVPYIGVASSTTPLGGTPVGGSFFWVPNSWSPFLPENYGRSDHEFTRQSFPKQILSSTANRYVISEPLMHPIFEDHDEVGLSNVREMAIQIVFDADITKLFSAYTAITGLSVNLVAEAPKLLVRYVEVNDSSKIPFDISIPYQQHVIKQTSGATGLALGASAQTTMNNLVYGQVASKFIIYVKERTNNMTYLRPHTFARINNINMTIGNRSGLLSSSSPQMLYQMSVRNGLSLNWKQFNGSVGSILVIDVGSDLGALQAGAIGNLSVSFDVNYTNCAFDSFLSDTQVNPYPVDYDVYCVAVLEGKMIITQDSSSLSMGLTIQDQLEAESQEPISVEGVPEGKGMYGGSMKGWRKFLRGLRRNLNKANNVAQKVAPLMANNPYASGAAKILGSVTDTANALEIGKEGSGMRGRGVLRL